MKYWKFKTAITGFAALVCAWSVNGQVVKTDFGGQQSPYRCDVVVESVDCETTQNIDILLPDNFRYVLEGVQTIVRTAPTTVTNGAKVAVSSYDGSSATQIKGEVELQASAAGGVDFLFTSLPNVSGYVYYQNIAAASTSGLCTQNTSLDSAGAIAGETDPDVPRKLVITTVDNAGDDLAGTVTLTGVSPDGETITEVVTIVAGTDSHTTENVFATFDTATHDFGATGEATNDTLDIGGATAIGLPASNAKPYKIVAAGTEEAAASTDTNDGAVVFTTAPDGTNDYEVWYSTMPQPTNIVGGNYLRLVITGSEVDGSDVRDVVLSLLKY